MTIGFTTIRQAFPRAPDSIERKDNMLGFPIADESMEEFINKHESDSGFESPHSATPTPETV